MHPDPQPLPGAGVRGPPGLGAQKRMNQEEAASWAKLSLWVSVPPGPHSCLARLMVRLGEALEGGKSAHPDMCAPYRGVPRAHALRGGLLALRDVQCVFSAFPWSSPCRHQRPFHLTPLFPPPPHTLKPHPGLNSQPLKPWQSLSL